MVEIFLIPGVVGVGYRYIVFLSQIQGRLPYQHRMMDMNHIKIPLPEKCFDFSIKTVSQDHPSVRLSVKNLKTHHILLLLR